MRASRAEHRDRWQEYGEARRRWAAVMVTDLAVDDKDRVALTPYTAPSGQQILRTFVEKPVTAVRQRPETVHEALAGWVRVEGFTGEYFDHRVLRSSADDIQADRAGRAAYQVPPGSPLWRCPCSA